MGIDCGCCTNKNETLKQRHTAYVMLSNCDIRKVMAIVIMVVVVVVVVAITDMFPSFSFVFLVHLFRHF